MPLGVLKNIFISLFYPLNNLQCIVLRLGHVLEVFHAVKKI